MHNQGEGRADDSIGPNGTFGLRRHGEQHAAPPGYGNRGEEDRSRGTHSQRIRATGPPGGNGIDDLSKWRAATNRSGCRSISTTFGWVRRLGRGPSGIELMGLGPRRGEGLTSVATLNRMFGSRVLVVAATPAGRDDGLHDHQNGWTGSRLLDQVTELAAVGGHVRRSLAHADQYQWLTVQAQLDS